MSFRRLVLAAVVVGALAPAPGTAGEAPVAFVEGFEDVPLMPGLALVEGAGLAFDAPQGRIVEAVARGRVAPGDVLAFYGATLPQLGWSGTGSLFRREGEVLRIEITRTADGVTVRYFLSPQK